jgi:hypothetical protein
VPLHSKCTRALTFENVLFGRRATWAHLKEGVGVGKTGGAGGYGGWVKDAWPIVVGVGGGV